MPEGPSIVILKEEVKKLGLEGQIIECVGGNTTIDKERLLNKKVLDFKSWGKHFLICFDDFTLRIHFMLFGSYRINERKESLVRLSIGFKHDELNFYTCSVKFIEANANDFYDWSADVMSDEWDHNKAIKKTALKTDTLICDVLLDQNIFSGVGNIIKNEVLYRVGLHPLNKVSAIPKSKLALLIKETRIYSFDFLKWKKAFVLKKHWLVHTKKNCPLGHPIEKAYLGKTNRRNFYCSTCQKLYE